MENLKGKSIENIVSRLFNIDIKIINDDLSRDNVKEWDSFNHLLLISEIEKEFDIKLTLKEIGEANTIGYIKKIIKLKRSMQV